MSEQSGPITREQVERAIDAAYDCNAQGVNAALGAFWYEREDIPADVRDGWRQVGYLGLRIALARWRDELAAAEPVRRVARWDVERGAYVAHDNEGDVCMVASDRETAIGWGYEIEGGPEPVRDWKSDRAIAAIWPTPKPAEDSPERLRERREALGLSMSAAASLARINIDDVDALEGTCRRWGAASFAPGGGDCDRCGEMHPAYAAALSAEEARRAAKAKPVDIGYVPTDRERYPDRPAPRFKVGDWVRNRLNSKPWQVASVHWRNGWWAYVDARHDAPEHHLTAAEPASPPAPEVVDVPQPIVKRCGGVEAQWDLGEDHVTLVEPARGVGLPAPLALLRAMLAAIDAQQGGAS